MEAQGGVTILAGRTRRLWQPMLQQLRIAHDTGERCLLIVPEHYTLQAERALITGLGANGLLFSEVLSPSRLVQRVRDRAGAGRRVPIDDLGRSMTVMRALEKTRGDLWFYKGAAAFPGFSPKLASVIATFKEAGVGPDQIEESIAGWQENALQSKLHDAARVYAAYEGLLEHQFADEEDQARDVYARMADAALFGGQRVFVYGFDMFTQKLCDLILALAGQAAGVLVTVVSDAAQSPDGEAFAPVRESTNRLMDALAQRGIAHRFLWADKQALDAPEEIAHLEANLLNPRRPVYGKPIQAAHLFAAPSPYAEVRGAAERIALALRDGIPPSRVMVLCGSFERYAGVISSVFRDFGIPFYSAQKRPITADGLIRATLSALRCIADGWRREDVLAYIKSGFSMLEPQEAWALEQYANAYGIGGSRWRRPFDRGPQDERDRAEELRARLTAPLQALHAQLLKARTATDSIRAVLDFLHATQADARSQRLEQELLSRGLPDQAIRTRQVWARLCAMFEQMYALLEDARIPISSFADWLEAGLSAEQLSALPAAAECVQCGGIGRLIPDEPAVMVLMGLNDGILSGASEELLNDQEIGETEARLDTHFGIRSALKQQMALLDLWKAVSAPTQMLCLSYPLKDEEGNVLRPLGAVSAIRAMFPLLVEEGGALAPEESLTVPLAPAPALDMLAPMLAEGRIPPGWQDAWAHLCHDPAWRDEARQVYAAAGGEPPPQRIPARMAARLYDAHTTSVSRIETFAWCPFRHFVAYGLRPEPHREWRVEANEQGAFYHEVLEAFVRCARQEPAWPQVSRERCDAMLDALLPPALARREGTAFHDTARTAASVRGMERVIRRIAWLITKGAQVSSFRPEMAEVRFGYSTPGSLPALPLRRADGSLLDMHGLIDRIDRYAGPEGRFLRVIDYKSGTRRLTGEYVAGGQQLQLLAYLKAALQMDARYEAAGVFYQLLDDPMINGEDASLAENEGDKALRLSGIARDDVAIHRLMERAEQPVTLRTRFKNNGEPYAGQPLFSREEITALTDHAQRRAAELADAMFAGAVERRPTLERGGKSPCRYCEYAGICRRDPMDALTDARMLTPMSLRQLADSLLQGKN